MKYIVIFFEGYVGYHFDKYSKIFNDKQKAKQYCKELNIEFAKENGCSIKDLGDYYTIKKIEEDK